MRFILPVAALLAAAPACFAQEDYDLANALAERGWYDLSEDLFGRIKNSASLSPDQKAEGDYGLARIKIMMAERSDSHDEKSKLFDKAIKDVEGFLAKFPNHKRKGEALSDIGTLYQSKGKALVAAAKIDPTRMDEAEKAFGAAEKLFLDLVNQLKKEEPKRPEDPVKDKKAAEAFDAWEEKVMFAKYNYATALFSHAETFKDTTSKHADMKRLLEQMNHFLNNDFMWQYERYLLAFDAFIYMGRAYQLLAETSDRDKAEEYWKQCFIYVGKAKSLLSDKDNRGNEAVRDIAARSLLFEMKARMTYGDVKRGQTGAKQYGDAANLAENFFKMFPNMRFEDTGKALRLEQARALCKSSQTDKGIKLLQELIKTNKDTWVENVAIDYLGEYAGNESVQLAIDSADNFLDRGPAFIYKAIQKYRRALQAIKKPEDQKFAPYCWAQLGKCYYLLGRHYEAVAAITVLESPQYISSKEAGEAAMRKLSSLQAISRATKDKADERAFEDYRRFVTEKFPGQANDQLLRQQAIAMDDAKKFEESVKVWEKLAVQGKDTFEEAIFSVAYSSYYHGTQLFDQSRAAKIQSEKDKIAALGIQAWNRSIDAFKKHLDFVEKAPTKDPKMVKRAVGAIQFSCRILTSERVNKPKDALDISVDVDKRFPNADARLVIGIMSTRIDAKLKLGEVQEAEDDLRALKAKFEKEQLGLEFYTRALAVVASAFEEAAEKLRGKDQEKYDLFAVKAATYYYEYYNLNPTAISTKPEQMEAMADKLFMAAQQRMAMGEAKIGKEGVEKAREIFDKARELYQGFLLQKERSMPKDQVRSMNARVTRCLLMTGRFEEAIKMYESVVKDDLDMKDGSSWEDLSDCYVEKARSLPKGVERNDYLRKADKNYAALSARLMQAQAINEHTWRLLHKHADCLWELDLDALRRFYDFMDSRGYGGPKKWDADDAGASRWGFQARFEDLRKKLDEKVPPTKKP